MKSFREAKIQYLIATDVAARGLDVDGVTHVFNYDIPEDVEVTFTALAEQDVQVDQVLQLRSFATKDEKHLEEIEKSLVHQYKEK